MLKNKRLLLIPIALLLLTVPVLGLRIGYPFHRLTALILIALGWIPLVASYRINRRLLRVQKTILKKKTRPFLPHIMVATILICAFYFTWVLIPVANSTLTSLSPEEVRSSISSDRENYRMLLKAADDIVNGFNNGGLLQRQVSSLSPQERAKIRTQWRDGVMAFVEFDILKEKYKGFYQIDYVAMPQLHADAFMIAYMAYIAQYKACLEILAMLKDNEFMEALLNEPGEGIPQDSFFVMKRRLTSPTVILRLNAAMAYYELVKKDTTLDPAIVIDFEARRKALLKQFGSQSASLANTPFDVLERAAFEALFPLQKNVAIQMSYIRTAQRDYLITPEIIARHQHLLLPGDILLQRRNWHMTNIGIPGFWPHAALYVGTPAEIDAYFGTHEQPQPTTIIRNLYPDVLAMLEQADGEGFPHRVIEAIRPGVVFQSLETSAKCDYLAVIRPNLSRADTFKAILTAFSHFAKPYDLNFDFATDNELVCSELVYKAYQATQKLPFQPEVVSGRLLLSPNRMVEQIIENLDGPNAPFSFILFLDAVEKTDAVIQQDKDEFKKSWQRPKWDILQK